MLKLLTKPSPMRTLRAMKVGDEIEIPCRIVKAATVRSSASILKRKGYLFECTDRELYSTIKVRRLK
jgi:ribosomal protein L19